MSNTNNNDLNAEREKVIEKITRWLKEENHIIQRENKSDSYYFGSVILPPTEKDKKEVFYINIPNSFRDKIFVEKVGGFSNIDKQAFDKLSQFEQNEFIFELKDSLLRTNIGFSFHEVVKVKLYKIVFFDGLSKTSLFDALMSIFSADRITHIVYGRLSDKLNQK